MGRYLKRFNERLQITDKSRYNREQYQSYMTGPEWRNVEMAEEFGAFLRDNKSLFQFPYFRQIVGLWKIIYRSFATARKYNTISSILFSEYMMMDIFVGVFTTFELFPKAIVSLLLYPFLKKENPSEMQGHMANFYETYAHNLETIPFYDHKYKEARLDLSQKYKDCKHRTWVDWFSWTCISLELRARHWISKPLSYWFHQDDNLVPATTDILVKFDSWDEHDPARAKELFKTRLANLNPEYAVSIVADDIYAKEKDPNKNYISIYARLSVPRYKAFQPVVGALADEGIHIRKIAGQDNVQVKCVIDAADSVSLSESHTTLNQTRKVVPLYTYSDDIHPNRKFCLFDVPVKNLDKTLRRLEKESDVKFIHNF